MSNNRMHATRDTNDVIFPQSGWRARDARRYTLSKEIESALFSL
jgi:hypothetical protein